MRYLALAYLVLLIFLSCKNSESNIITDLQKDNLKGDIQMSLITEYEIEETKDSLESRDIKKVARNYYNKNGFLIKEESFDPITKTIFSKDIIYDTKGNLSEIISLFNNVPEFKQKFLYNNDGLCIEENTISLKSNNTEKTLIKYDSKKNAIEKLFYNEYGELFNKQIIKEERDLLKTERNNYDKDGKISTTQIISKNSIGKIIEDVLYSSDGSIIYRYTYKYDNQGNIIEQTLFDDISKIKRVDTYKNQYDKHGNIISSLKFINSRPVSIKRMEYNFFN